MALAPHLDHEVLLEPEDLAILHAVSPSEGQLMVELVATFGAARIANLVETGLLLGDHPGHAELRGSDQALRDVDWWPPAAVAHRFGRWHDVDVAAEEHRNGKRTLAKLMADRGEPPTEAAQCRPEATWHSLPPPVRTELDELLARRSTCRNFDTDAHLPLAELSSVLQRVFGAQATQQLAPGAVALKKNSPSGGGLHPIEAYLLVQRVDGLEPGLYHYQSVAHALEPMRLHDADALAGIAHELVAGQSWFANSPVHILMAARFQRNFWKYRKHPKAWRVIQLDAGHLSQNLYLSATELGYGAFITGAINDECAERLFELDAMQTGSDRGLRLRSSQPRGADDGVRSAGEGRSLRLRRLPVRAERVTRPWFLACAAVHRPDPAGSTPRGCPRTRAPAACGRPDRGNWPG